MTAAAESPQFRLIGQYLRDLSFECPLPAFKAAARKQDMALQVMVGGRALGNDEHEVSIRLKGENKTDDGKTAYLVEVDYAGVFVAKNIPAAQLSQLLAIEGPSLLFPYARHVLMSAVADGGYRPGLIEPINFHALYLQAQAQAGQDQKTA